MTQMLVEKTCRLNKIHKHTSALCVRRLRDPIMHFVNGNSKSAAQRDKTSKLRMRQVSFTVSVNTFVHCTPCLGAARNQSQ